MSEDPTAREGPPRAAHEDDIDAMPRRVARFVVEEQLGIGGMGRVYAAHDPTLDRRVALKVLRDEVFADLERAHGRMAREARAMARLRHPNVVTVYEVGEDHGRLFIVMEYVAGTTLRGWVDAGGDRLGWEQIVSMYVDAGRGLAAAHAAGLVHRDFKPDNVLVEAGTNRVLVTDFGIANAYGDNLAGTSVERVKLAAPLTRTGAVVGTPPYMSPEQHLAAPSDARTDQFSFCAALYEALYGVRPFAGEDLDTIAQNAISGKLSRPRLQRGVPARIHAAIMRGLAIEPSGRFPSMTRLLDELAVRPRRGWLVAAIAASAAVVAGAGIVVWAVVHDSSPAPAPAPVAAPTPACDCEVVTLRVPSGARVVGVTPIGAHTARVAMPDMRASVWVPRGRHTIDYEIDGRLYGYAVDSNGRGAARIVELPAPELRDGYVFVPGGDVPIGDLDGHGELNERPVATVHLDPYLIATREEPQLATWAEAVERAHAHHARLPSAAEWEWAARIGVIDGALANEWEWTATTFSPYPYDTVHDDPFADTGSMELRGGQIGECLPAERRAGACPGDDSDRPRVSRRLDGRRGGGAELRLARTPTSSPVGELRIETSSNELAASDIAKVHRWVWRASELDPTIALEAVARDPGRCTVFGLFGDYDQRRIEFKSDPRLAEEVLVIRPHPDPQHRENHGRIVCSDTSIEILDEICFEGRGVTPGTDKTLAALAGTLTGNPSIKLVEIQGYVPADTPDPQAESMRRASLVRDKLIDDGVSPERLVAQGYGIDKLDNPATRGRRALMGRGCATGGRIGTMVLKRTGDN